MKTCVLASIVSLALAAPLWAQDETPSSSSSAEDASDLLRRDDPDNTPERGPLSSQPGSLVVLRGLDKVTARTRDFEVAIGDTVQFGALSITAQYCRKRPPEETPETYAFLQVNDRRTDGFGVDVEGEPIFSGWMFASRPAQNPLEHPVYDVWVIDCRA
ncbi:DUF2155 domain-containing protein [Maricaulis maris]|uniref:DUF2155 domain-containing protein n=1 Tax=Maricaulis maris TaxID=74318 RepID=A0A495DMD1_9PROT|nr:DUF2155 domain-containing protein [Maricaulis maris]RKR03098.1 hypothetical protein C7435_1046 [Maricaulis maris]